jgi:hypothetical protein
MWMSRDNYGVRSGRNWRGGRRAARWRMGVEGGGAAADLCGVWVKKEEEWLQKSKERKKKKKKRKEGKIKIEKRKNSEEEEEESGDGEEVAGQGRGCTGSPLLPFPLIQNPTKKSKR